MKPPQPPEWPQKFLLWFCREDLAEAILGDLVEIYERKHQQLGKKRADWLFVFHVILFFQPFAFKKTSQSTPSNHITMFRHFFKISWRSFGRNKAFSFISLLGLATGMVALLFIGEYVRFEESYDEFHQNGEHLYRLRAEGWHNDGRKWFQGTANFPVAGPQVAEKVPEVVAFTRLKAIEAIMSPQGEKQKSYKETDMYYADSSFLEMFSFPLVLGDPGIALKEPNSIVLTTSMALKYFGKTDVLGQYLVKNQEESLTITGVLQDVPENSHLEFDFLISYYTEKDPNYYENWGWTDFYTYVQVSPGADITQLHDQFDEILHERKGEYYENVDAKEFWRLQALNQIHLHSGFNNKAGLDGQANIIHLLLAIGIFVMILAWINFVNISTARAIERGIEVGVRKAIGATRMQVIAQFLIEAFLLNGLAMLAAVLIVKALGPTFSVFTGHAATVEIWQQSLFWKTALGVWVLGSIASGFYPAFVMSSFRPVSVLKGKRMPGGSFSLLRKGLVVFQFAMSIGLVIGTVSIYRQIQFMRSQNLGFRMDQIYTLHGPQAFPIDSTFAEHLTTFRTDLLTNPRVQQFTASQSVPGFGVSSWGGYIRRGDRDGSHAKTYQIMQMDDKFLETYDRELIAGRNFSRDRTADRESVIISEKALQDLEFESPESAIGQMIFCPLYGSYDGTKAQVIGVVKDHHQYSLRSDYQPIIYTYSQASPEFFSLLLDTEDLNGSLSYIRETWREHFGAEPFDGFFLDEQFNRSYQADLLFGNICALFAGLAIFIALLGLFGLSTYMTIQRTKEISIRKVLGANVPNIVSLLSRQYLLLVFLSGVTSVPFAYWAVQKWLEGFAFHMSTHPMLFIIPVIATVMIAALAVSWQTIKSARTNPADSLRHS